MCFKHKDETINNVKLRKKDNAMKTKTLITTVALSGALLASASVAKANAFLELISGTSTTSVATGISDSLSGNFSVGGWTVNTTTGTSLGFGTILSVTESTVSGGAAPTHGLTILYSSGLYNQDGAYTFSGTENAGTVGSTVALYFASAVANAGTSIPGGLGSLVGGPYSLTGTGGSSSSSPTATGTTAGIYSVNELMTIGGGAGASLSGAPATANVQDTLTVKGVIVPDGGMTLTMFGSVMLGLAGLRSKFAGKRS
jgi:hypothetical protein